MNKIETLFSYCQYNVWYFVRQYDQYENLKTFEQTCKSISGIYKKRSWLILKEKYI